MRFPIKSSIIIFLATFVSLALSAPSEDDARAVHYEEKPSILELPYGSFEASSKQGVVWTFKNIPYAAPPLGDLRWEKPAPPLNYTGVQRADRNETACFQVFEDDTHVEENEHRGKSKLTMDSILSTGEDCLFLDVQVPDRALKDPSLDLPVVVFIHGDGRKARTKPLVPLYDGHGLIEASEEEIIYVTFNYRLGAFGFLAGKTMEEQAIPNVGLWDQRAVFQWVRDHISKINGDPTQVTAMGHSGGATSIISHLTAAGGTLDPLFHRAILLSPAFLPMWDRRGLVELRFQLFAMFAGCEGRGIECLRRTNSSILQKANRELTWIGVKGNFPVGPTPDGSYIRQLPALELASKNVWPIESLILSHTGKEAENLVAATDVTDNAAFEIFLNGTMPDYVTNSTLFGKIKEHYPDITYLKGSTYMEHKDRMTAFLRDWCVTCNIRWLVEAFGENKTWVMNYNMPPANHGADLLSLFFHYDLDPGSIKDFWAAIRSTVSRSTMNHVMKVHKSYIASFIRTGNPNKHRYRWRLPRVGSIAHSGEWKNPENISNGEHVNDVMEVDPDRFEAFDYALDENMPRSRCQFWKSFFVNVTIQGGYLPSAELKRPTGVRDRGMDDKNNITNKQKTAN